MISFNIKGVRAYADTITLFSRHPLPTQIYKDVRELQEKPLVYEITPVRGRDGSALGYQFLHSIHQPRIATLQHLARLPRAKASVHAVHIAFDFLVSDPKEALSAREYFCTHLRQTWRRPQDCRPEFNSFYWKRDRKEARNITVYCDRPSKTGGGHCCHLELRFTGAEACARAGLSDLAGLSRGIDALATLKHETKLAVVDPIRFDRAVERLARKYFPTTKSRCSTTWVEGASVELTVSRLGTKMRELIARSMGVAPVEEHDVLRIRSQDIWDSRHRALRSALVEVPWEEVCPRPVWHAWR